jgi:hypothetical protein
MTWQCATVVVPDIVAIAPPYAALGLPAYGFESSPNASFNASVLFVKVTEPDSWNSAPPSARSLSRVVQWCSAIIIAQDAI